MNENNRDRPAAEPGGCECMGCGAIFIGAAHHTVCAICLPEKPETSLAACFQAIRDDLAEIMAK